MSEHLEQATLARLTADIVSAYVAHHDVTASDVSQLIGAVGGKLAGLEVLAPKAAAEVQKAVPAVPVRRSIAEDYLICLLCGQPQKLLRRHLRAAHDLAPDDYRDMFGLKAEYPMTPPAFRAMRSALAKKTGLGRPKKVPTRNTKASPKRTK